MRVKAFEKPIHDAPTLAPEGTRDQSVAELATAFNLKGGELVETYGPPHPQEVLFGWQLIGLHQRIRHIGKAVAKMESRTPLAS